MRRSRVLAALVAILLTWLLPSAALAGKNAGGALIVHTQDAYVFSAGTVCTTTYGQPASCEEAVTRSDKDTGTVVWVLAAFDSTANPAVAGIYFGLNYSDSLSVENWKMCAPTGSVELPDSGWPGAGTGNSIAFGMPIVGNHLFPFYVFKIDGGTDSSYFSTAINPTGGYAAFIDGGFPPVMDDVTHLGTVRWYTLGQNACPSSIPDDDSSGHSEDENPPVPTGACCESDGQCVSRAAEECTRLGGEFLGYQSSCSSTTCVSAPPAGDAESDLGVPRIPNERLEQDQFISLWAKVVNRVTDTPVSDAQLFLFVEDALFGQDDPICSDAPRHALVLGRYFTVGGALRLEAIPRRVFNGSIRVAAAADGFWPVIIDADAVPGKATGPILISLEPR